MLSLIGSDLKYFVLKRVASEYKKLSFLDKFLVY